MIMLEESPKITALDIMGTEANLPLRRPYIKLSDKEKYILSYKINTLKNINR